MQGTEIATVAQTKDMGAWMMNASELTPGPELTIHPEILGDKKSTSALFKPLICRLSLYICDIS